jgi:hypothetical protein
MDQLVPAVAQTFAGHPVRPEEPAVGIEDEDGVADVVEQSPELRFGLPQRLLRAFLLAALAARLHPVRDIPGEFLQQASLLGMECIWLGSVNAQRT